MVKKNVVKTPEELAEIINTQLDALTIDKQIELDLANLEITFDFIYNDHVEKVLENKGYKLKMKKVGENETKWVHITKDKAEAEIEFIIVIDFKKTEFKKRADFNYANFSSNANFIETTFSSEADFMNATFSSTADFRKATFSKDASFMNATFSSRADFWKAPFLRKADFYKVTFSGEADFWKATFSNNADFMSATFSNNADFMSATFSREANFKGAKFEQESDFRYCKFLGETGFTDTKFESTTSFFRAEFDKNAVFYQTRFEEAAIFSQVIFKGHALFVYSMISKVLVLQGVTFYKDKEQGKGKGIGLDLASATITGTINPFGFSLQQYATSNKVTLEEYYKKVDESLGKDKKAVKEIPTRIKRETFRILKEAFEKQNNIVESLELKKLEKKALAEELKSEFRTKFWDLINLYLNRFSNKYGTSYIKSLLFTSIVAFVFFTTSICFTNYDLWEKFWCPTTTNYFFQFLNPIHNPNYLGTEVEEKGLFYVLDFLGRVFVGYGIYQFIQAFRKYR